MRLLLGGLLLCVVAFVVALRMGATGATDPVHEDSGRPARPVLVAHDSSGLHHSGVIQGAPVIGLPGHRGTSYSFDKRGSWVEVPSTGAINPGRRPFSVSAWVRFSATPEGSQTFDIVRKGLSFTRTGEFKLEIIRDGLVRCTTKDVEGRRARISGPGHPVTDGHWHRIGCSRAATSWTVHVDRWSETEADRLGDISNTMPLSLGSKYGLEDMPEGRLDDVRLRIGGRTVGHWELDEKPSR
ncbi:MAG TPA: LamG-like jellyroll fold domain-containing protein [Nocardioidaceae bacterium]|nr:LamG-like jellyroll fold domain-containing protein [Nocardioidaceae bacterium]